MRSLLEYYGMDNDTYYKQERLNYITIERMVRFFYESGKVPFNDYVYYANKMVEMVFSADKDEWEKRFREWYDLMYRGGRGTRTIARFGTRLWPDLFRAFYFAEAKWTEKEKLLNIVNLIDLYDICSKKDNEKKNHVFDQGFIEDWITLWETLPEVSCFSKAFGYICSLEIIGNFNHYNLFYSFLGKSINALYMNGFITHPEPWKYEVFLEDNFKTDKSDKLVKEVIHETECNVNKAAGILEQVPDIRPQEMHMYKAAGRYLEFMQRVMNCDVQAAVRERPFIKTEVHSPVTEKAAEVRAMEGRDFWNTVKNNSKQLPVVILVGLIRDRLNQLQGLEKETRPE